VSRDIAHDKYDAMREALNAALKAVGEFAKVAPQFEWETNHIADELQLARRYAGKPGEVLYCNWRWCEHAKPYEDQERGQDIDAAAAAEARALSDGESIPYFKGLVHPECMEAIKERRH
jgi:hypothetical protein